jgi:hypothetical protein
MAAACGGLFGCKAASVCASRRPCHVGRSGGTRLTGRVLPYKSAAPNALERPKAALKRVARAHGHLLLRQVRRLAGRARRSRRSGLGTCRAPLRLHRSRQRPCCQPQATSDEASAGPAMAVAGAKVCAQLEPVGAAAGSSAAAPLCCCRLPLWRVSSGGCSCGSLCDGGRIRVAFARRQRHGCVAEPNTPPAGGSRSAARAPLWPDCPPLRATSQAPCVAAGARCVAAARCGGRGSAGRAFHVAALGALLLLCCRAAAQVPEEPNDDFPGGNTVFNLQTCACPVIAPLVPRSALAAPCADAASAAQPP